MISVPVIEMAFLFDVNTVLLFNRGWNPKPEGSFW